MRLFVCFCVCLFAPQGLRADLQAARVLRARADDRGAAVPAAARARCFHPPALRSLSSGFVCLRHSRGLSPTPAPTRAAPRVRVRPRGWGQTVRSSFARRLPPWPSAVPSRARGPVRVCVCFRPAARDNAARVRCAADSAIGQPKYSRTLMWCSACVCVCVCFRPAARDNAARVRCAADSAIGPP